MSTVEFETPRRRFETARGRASRRRPRRRPRRADRRLPAGQAGPPRDRVRGRGPGRRHRQDRGPRRLPLRPRRPPLLHQVQGGRGPLARGDERGVPPAPADVADLLERQVPRLPAQGHGRRSRSSARSSSCAPASPTCGRPSSPRAARTTSSSGSPTASASASTSSSSRPTPRRCGASRRTELRAEWAAQRIKGLSFFSAAKAAFFGNKGNKIKSLITSSTTRASARGRCGRRWPTRSSPPAARCA